MQNQILRLTATEAARQFSELLDRVEAGAEAIIERHSEAVAIILPAAGAPRKLSECLAVRLPRPSVRPDPAFAADLEAIIRGNPSAEFPDWE